MKVKTSDGKTHDLTGLRDNEITRFVHANDAVPVAEKADDNAETRPAKADKVEKR